MDPNQISPAALRIRNKLIKEQPLPLALPQLPPVVGDGDDDDDDDDEGEWLPIRSVSTSEDGVVIFSESLGDPEIAVPVVDDIGPTITMITAIEDFEKNRTGLLFLYDDTCAGPKHLQAQEVATFLYSRRNNNAALEDLNYYELNFSEQPLVAMEMALNYRGPEIVAVLSDFPQVLDCEPVGAEVEAALSEKVKKGLVEICSKAQASLFAKRFPSAVIGVYKSLTDHSYRLVSEAASFMKDVEPGVKFSLTCETAAVKQLVPVAYGRKNYIAVRHNGRVYPYIGRESLSGVIKFVCTTLDINLKRLPTATPDTTESKC